MKSSEVKSILKQWLNDNFPDYNDIESIDSDFCQSGEALIKTKAGNTYILSITPVDPNEIDEI